MTQAIEAMRPRVVGAASLRDKLQELWAGAVKARDCAAYDVWLGDLESLAAEAGIPKNDDLDHVLRWAWLNRNPWR